MRLLADEVARSKLGCVAALCCLLNPLTLVAVLSVVHRLFQRLFWRPRLTLANLQARRRTPPPTTAQQLVAALIAANNGHSVALNVVQIGANSGDFNRSNHRDRDAVRPAMLSLLQQPQTRAVLLEPDLSTYRLLERGLHRCQRDWLRRGCSAHVVARHAALCPRAASSSSASSIELFRIAIDRLPKAARDWNERVNGHWAAGEMSSLTRDFVVRAVAHGPGIGLANASKFVDAVRVPCTTAHELLTLPPIEPSAPLGALVVDTEGLEPSPRFESHPLLAPRCHSRPARAPAPFPSPSLGIHPHPHACHSSSS